MVKEGKAPKPVIEMPKSSLWRKSDIDFFAKTGKVKQV